MKKLVSLLLVVLLFASLLSGCQKDEPTSTDEPNTDAVVAASLEVETDLVLEKSIGTEGKWIVCTIKDITTDKELVIDGEFHNKDDAAQDLYRKLALYAQDADKNVTARYTLTAPKLTVKSPNTNIQGGTFVGDVYVESEGFAITDATINGDVYFASEELKASFTIKNGGNVTGKIVVAGVDVVTSPTVLIDDIALEKAIAKDGAWIIITLNNIATKKELVIEGEFHNKDDAAQDLYRKLALYAQDADKNVTARYSLTAPKLTIKSPNTKIQGGTFVGDVYVEANGFNVTDATIEGNVFFATEEFKSTFVTEKEGKVTGTTEVQK